MKKFIIYDPWRNVWLSSDDAKNPNWTTTQYRAFQFSLNQAKRRMKSIMDFDDSIIELEVNPAQDNV